MSNNLKGNPVEGFAEKSREAAVEGIVLLKNEGNVLPLTEDDKISVFGRPMIEYYRSGTGSGGAVNVEYTTNILDGFENSNLNLNKKIVEDYKEWLKDHHLIMVVVAGHASHGSRKIWKSQQIMQRNRQNQLTRLYTLSDVQPVKIRTTPTGRKLSSYR